MALTPETVDTFYYAKFKREDIENALKTAMGIPLGAVIEYFGIEPGDSSYYQVRVKKTW